MAGKEIATGELMKGQKPAPRQVQREAPGYVWFDAKDKSPDTIMQSVEVKCADGFQCVAWFTDEGEWNMDLPFDCDHILKNVIAWKELTPFSD